MSVKLFKWSSQDETGEVVEFLKRPAFDEQAEEVARRALADIRSNGDKAVAECIARFDGVLLQPREFLVPKEDIADARKFVSDDVRSAVREAHKRIARFAKAGLKKDWSISTPRGGSVGEQFVPFDRVGVYVPGGAAPLVSTALMTVTLAKVAGVPEIVACTPCGKDGKVLPETLYALEAAGATEIYRIGGIQAIGAMAYGTETVRKVQKIVGPGGAFVTAAKRQVYGQVALDLVAGPSEIAILADDTAVPAFVAADLLSQAEHGTGHEKALFVTSSMKLAQAVQGELETQASQLSRQDAVRKVMGNGMLLVVVNNLTEGMELCNRFAPEHFEIMVREPQKWPRKVKHAGAVFVGTWSPEAAGDYVAGPSHVLPTGGAARMFSGLTVDDFRKRTSIIAFTKADLQDVLPTIETFGRIEGLDAHAKSARIRFERG
jgi:histidinol dehydrogenase